MPTRTPIIVPRKSKLNKQQEQQQVKQEKNCVLTLYLIKIDELEIINGTRFEANWLRMNWGVVNFRTKPTYK